MTLLLALLAVSLLAMLARRRWLSFDAQTPLDYAGTGPIFDIRERLSGPIVSEGMIFGPTGRVATRFVAEMRGAWDGDCGTLNESFHYAAGGAQEREWHLTMGADGAFTATADDVIGVARGQQRGAAVQMRYRLRLPAESGGHVLDVTDWLYLLENGAMLNRSEMRKFGFKVAELVASMRRGGGDV